MVLNLPILAYYILLLLLVTTHGGMQHVLFYKVKFVFASIYVFKLHHLENYDVFGDIILIGGTKKTRLNLLHKEIIE